MPESSTPAATDQQIVERLAVEVMGWETGTYEGEDRWYDFAVFGSKGTPFDWSPLTDWNHWRQVEEKVFENPSLTLDFANELYKPNGMGTLSNYVTADLRTRCLALISVLDQSHA